MANELREKPRVLVGLRFQMKRSTVFPKKGMINSTKYL